MKDLHDIIASAVSEAESLRNLLLKKKSVSRVRAEEERSLVKATALAWFRNHRVQLAPVLKEDSLADIDALYKEILAASHKQCSRSGYVSKLKNLKSLLVELGSQTVDKLSSDAPLQQTTDQPPNFAPLISDPAMQKILHRRWQECTACIGAGASLAATVMMGGLLEALLLARINRETDKSPIFKAATAPKDTKTGKTKPLNEWMLMSYIDVTHEMGWISKSAKDVGSVLREYRNYIHPYKELSHGVVLETTDAKLLWEVSKNISRQVIDSVK